VAHVKIVGVAEVPVCGLDRHRTRAGACRDDHRQSPDGWTA